MAQCAAIGVATGAGGAARGGLPGVGCHHQNAGVLNGEMNSVTSSRNAPTRPDRATASPRAWWQPRSSCTQPMPQSRASLRTHDRSNHCDQSL